MEIWKLRTKYDDPNTSKTIKHVKLDARGIETSQGPMLKLMENVAHIVCITWFWTLYATQSSCAQKGPGSLIVWVFNINGQNEKL